MYTPKSFAVTDPAVLHDFMQTNNFAALVSQDVEDGGLVATHLPLMLHPERGTHGMLIGHMARANDQWKHLSSEREVLMIFQGPHTYISASWYEQRLNVPTWNYAVVHAYGTPRLIEDAEELLPMLHELAGHHEAGFEQPWSMANVEGDEKFMKSNLGAIVGLEVCITRLEGKFKMSQNRTQTDQTRVVAALTASDYPPDQAVAAVMRERLNLP